MNGEDEHASLLRLLAAAGYGEQPEAPPQMAPSPGFRLGRLKVGGGTLDNLSASILQAGPPPRGRGLGQDVAGGFVQGFARARAGRAQGRQAAFEAKSKGVADRNEARQKFLEGAVKDQENERQMRSRPGTTAAKKMVKLTPEIRKELADRKIFLSSAVSELPEDSQVFTRDESTADPLLGELRQARLNKMQEDASQAQAAEGEKGDYAKGIADFAFKPTDIPKRDPKWYADVVTRANSLLAAKGSKYNFQQLEQLWGSTKKWTETSNAQRAVNTRKAAMTVLDHINQFEESMGKYREMYDNLPFFKKQELKLTNQGIYAAAKNGVFGPAAAEEANALETIVSVLPTEYATVLSGGFAPQQSQLEESARVFNPALGPQGHKGRMKAIKRLIKARVDNEQRNFNIIGGKDNPYLMEISKMEGWDLDEPLDISDPDPVTAPAKGGKAAKHGARR